VGQAHLPYSFSFLMAAARPLCGRSVGRAKRKGVWGEGIFARPQFCVSKNLMIQQFSLKNVRAFL
jgi:hypothetical protein